MPFTLSHAAAALPFRRTHLVMSALVMGTFAPDFEYFIPFWHHGAFGHTLAGVFEFDLPVALVALWAFHHYAKEPLAACLPEGARDRLHLGPRSLSISSPSQLALIAFSILVGIATHIVWDSFTHPAYWLYYHWHFLRTTMWVPLFGRRLWCDILQYISSVLGLVIILLWYLHWYRNAQPVHVRSKRRSATRDRIAVVSAFIIALVVAVMRAAASGVPNGVHGAQRFMAAAAITAITALWIQLLIYGFIRNHRRSTT